MNHTYRICQVDTQDIMSAYNRLVTERLSGEKVLYAELLNVSNNTTPNTFPLRINYSGNNTVMFQEIKIGDGIESEHTSRIAKILSFAGFNIDQKNREYIGTCKNANLFLEIS